jgi:signal transduction histidine kinase
VRWVKALPPRVVDAGIALLCYLATVLPKHSSPAVAGGALTLSLAALASVPLVVQESLTNVVRHAAASQVWISLDWASDRLGLEVRDDGNGPGAPNGGHGISGMRERVSAFGGELDTGHGPDGTGFRVVATLPVGHDG